MELWSKELDIASSRVQEHWQVSAVHIVPLGIDFWSVSMNGCCVKRFLNSIDAGALLQVCPGLPVVTTLDNNRTSRF